MKGNLVPQFDPTNAATTAALIAGPTEFTIPALGSGEPAKYIALSVDVDTPVVFKVGLAGVDSGVNPHGAIALGSGTLIINVAGQTTIDFTATETGEAYVVPIANQ
jgi:hypothetical protein